MNLTPDATHGALPPPSVDEAARREHELDAWARHQRSKRLRPWWMAGGALAVVGVIGLSAVGSADDDSGKKYTLVEAACKLLREGDEPELVYSVMKDLAADHPLQLGEDEALAARLAVERAQAQGC